jgi:PPOX class probable F420-dependent enzyme
MTNILSDWAKKLLREEHFAVLSTLNKDGSSHLTTMWYLLENDGTIVMSTPSHLQKVKNLRRDPRIAICVEDGNRYVSLPKGETEEEKVREGRAFPHFVQLVGQKSHASPHSCLDQRSDAARKERRKAVTAATAADWRNKTDTALCSRQNTNVAGSCCLVEVLEA